MDAWHVSLDHAHKRVDRSALYFCGFPTLQHIKHKVSVRVCAQTSDLVINKQPLHEQQVLISSLSLARL